MDRTAAGLERHSCGSIPIRRFALFLVLTWWNVGFSAIFGSPEAIPDITLMAAVPTLFSFVGCYLFPAIGTLNYLPASHWAWNKMSIYLPPYIFAFLGAEDYLTDSPMELEWTSH